MRDLTRTMLLWIETAFRANGVLTIVMCLTSIIQAALPPLVVYGTKLTIDATSAGRPLDSGLTLIVLAILTSAITAKIAEPVSRTLDEQILRYVHDDLMRLATEIPSLNHYENPELLDRLSLVERDAWRMSGIFRLLSTLGAVTSTATVVTMLSTVSPVLVTLLVLALIPALTAALALYRRVELWLSQERYRRLTSAITDTLQNPQQGLEVRCFGLTRPLTDVAAAAMDIRRTALERQTWRYSTREALGWLAFGVIYALAVVWVIRGATMGQFTLGQVTLVLLIGPQVALTAQKIAYNIGLIVDAMSTFGRYHWLRDYAKANTWHDSRAQPPTRLTQGIRFEGVSFAYPSTSKDVLRRVNLELPAGATVAFVGANGAGKSTLVKLLARFYDPSAGAVTVDGVPLASINPGAWRQRISAGFQDFATFEFGAGDAIGVGDLTARANTARLDAAIAASQATDVVAGLPQGLDTQLGQRFEGGVGLSGGQWQRLALARAFMRDDPLLMLLDEPTAALDPEAEHAIYDSYARIARDLGKRTGAVTVLVSHRFSTVRMADLIVVVDDGCISELGTHDALLAAGGRYAAAFTLQAKTYS